MLTHVVLLQLPPAGCSRPSLGSELAGMMRHSSSSVVDLPVRPQEKCTAPHPLPSRLCSLLLSSTAAETPATELLRSSVSHTRQLTFAPRTPVCPSAGWLRGHVSGKGACRVPAPMTVRPGATSAT